MLNVKNLVKSFDNNLIISNISFNVVKGQILGFLGPNGAGKSTTMRMITGALHPDTGSIFACDIDVIKNPVLAKEHIGYLPEGAPLYEDMTPREYLYFMMNAKGLNTSKQKSNFENLINDAVITDVLEQKIGILSKGFKRRVALAGALINDPEILVLDEPTDGLDPNQKRHIRQLLKKLSQNKAIIISTHILEEVEAICNNTIIINKGRIVASASPKELMAMAPSYNAVIVIIQTQVVDNYLNHLKTLDVIQGSKIVKKMPHWTKVITYPKKKKYILNHVSEIINKQQFKIAEIRCDTGSIQDIFKEMTYG